MNEAGAVDVKVDANGDVVPLPWDPDQLRIVKKLEQFKPELTKILNMHSVDALTNTADVVLADSIIGHLERLALWNVKAPGSAEADHTKIGGTSLPRSWNTDIT